MAKFTVWWVSHIYVILQYLLGWTQENNEIKIQELVVNSPTNDTSKQLRFHFLTAINLSQLKLICTILSLSEVGVTF